MNKIKIFTEKEKNSKFCFSIAVAEDGQIIAHHTSSDLKWAKFDMGIIRMNEIYIAKYPDGYLLEFERVGE